MDQGDLFKWLLLMDKPKPNNIDVIIVYDKEQHQILTFENLEQEGV